MKKAFGLYILCVGLVVLVINVASILFSLGFVVVVVQVGARVLCDTVFSRTILGVSLQAACIR